MKNFLLVTFVLTSALLLSGCSDSGSQYNYSDSDNNEEAMNCLEEYKDAYDEVTNRAGNAAYIIETGDEANFTEVMDKMSEAFNYIDGIGGNEPSCFEDIDRYSNNDESENTIDCLEEYKDAYDEVTNRASNAAYIIETGDEDNYTEVMDKMSEAFNYIDGIGSNEPSCF